jgi:predicted house-cleaning noncanonical NTP pyrophosphatase (MazG superfamily)
LADILEVVYALAANAGVSCDELEEIRKKKAIDRGAFLKKLIIEYEK